MEATLTVFFDDPFWVGVFERIEDGKLFVCKVTFGAEPKMQLEKNKQERKVKSREQKLAEEERLFALKQQKKKEKHRGR